MCKADRVRLRHMLDAAREARTFVKDKQRSDLAHDRMLVLALVRSIEVIGEAASQVGRETSEAHGDVPWSQIVAMRNRLIHAYFDVDIGRVWDTVQDDLPPLIAKLEKILSESE